MTASALEMRMANFKALRTKGGLCNVAQQSCDVYQQHHATPEPTWRQRIIPPIASGTARSRAGRRRRVLRRPVSLRVSSPAGAGRR